MRPRLRCDFTRCRFSPAWLIAADGRADRLACTGHLGIVCCDGNPHTPLAVQLLPYAPPERLEALRLATAAAP